MIRIAPRPLITAALTALLVSGLAAGAVTAGTDDQMMAETTPDDHTTRLDTGGEEVTLRAVSDQEIRGETTVSEGSTVLVRLRSSGESPFIRRQEATVEEGGVFTVTFDLSDVSADDPTEVTIEIRRSDGALLREVMGTLQPAEAAQTSTESQPTTSSSVTTNTNSQTPGQPGFGTLVAVLALLGIAVLASRSE